MRQVNALDLAWAAGFLDGEGYFGCTHRHRRLGGFGTAAIEITAGQNVREPLDKLVGLFGGNVCIARPSREKRKEHFRWQLSGAANARVVLPLLLPHLTTKRREAELLLEIAALTPTQGFRITPEASARRHTLIGELREVRLA